MRAVRLRDLIVLELAEDVVRKSVQNDDENDVVLSQ